MKRTEFKKCALCDKGMMHDGGIIFYKVSIQTFGVDLRAVQRAAGLEQFLGGNAAIAHAMGPDEDLGIAVHDPETGLVCLECALRPVCLAQLLEVITPEEKENAG